MQQRAPGKHHAGLWEFPGGKVEDGETPRTALTRELAEELGLSIEARSWQPLAFAEEEGAPALVMFVYTARHRGPAPTGRDGQQCGWFTPAEAAALPLAPMDRQLLFQVARAALAKPGGAA